MPIRLISLFGVPNDEADEMRTLLRENNIVFYETPSGRWLMSLNAIWLHDDRHLTKARELIKAYQHERKMNARAEYEKLANSEKRLNLLQKIKQDPALYAFFLLVLTTIFWMLVFGVKH